MTGRALPFGQVNPIARPIGAFAQPSVQEPAGPARPALLGNPQGINTLQQDSGGSLTGFNRFEQVVAALAPFNKSLTELAATGMQRYAAGKIEEGFYLQLKNETAKAVLSLQPQAETGAANAAAQIGQLQKVDPPAAELLKESNPWMLIGRRRAAAQLVGSRIEDVLENDIEANGGELAKFRPGSPELKARQVQLTAQVLDEFGLTGDEPEVNFYVTPKVNQAWDKYQDKQRKYYSLAVEDSTKQLATAAMTALTQRVLTTDAAVDGQVFKIGSPEWRAYGAAVLTRELDAQLRLLDPEARSRTIKYIREQLAVFGKDPTGAQLLDQIRGGDSSVPYEKRPTWGESSPMEMLELVVRGQELAQKQGDLAQQAIGSKLDKLWYGTRENPGPGSLDPSDPVYPAALLDFRNAAIHMGYSNPEQYIAGRVKDQGAFVEAVRPPDPFAQEEFIVEVNRLPPGVWTDDPNSYANAIEQAKAVCSMEPTAAGKSACFARLRGEIDKARDEAGQFDPGVRDRVQEEVLQDLDSPAVRQIRDQQKVKGQQGDALAQALATRIQGGASVATALAATYQNAKLTAAANKLGALYERALSNAIRNWQVDRPGQVMSPSARSVVMSQAAADVRKSPQYAAIIKDLTGRQPGEVGPAVVGAKTGLKDPRQGRGVPRESSGALPASTVGAYAVRAVMEPRWVYSELDLLRKGKPISAEMRKLAERAKVSPYVYLQHQLKLYARDLDPDGSVQRWLIEKGRQEQSNRNVGAGLIGTVVPPLGGGYNPLGLGGWLVNMFTPPASAATLNLAPRMPRAGLGGGGGQRVAARSGGGGARGVAIAARNLPPQTRALLRTVRFAEGTDGPQGYNTMFTGRTFSDLSRHPRIINSSNGLSSDAAGAYQFLSTTWDSVGGGAMTPERQDMAAVRLIRNRGVDPSLPGGFTPQVADRLAPEWASFPTARTGTSYYGQGGKKFAELKAYYERALREEMGR